MYVDPGQAHGAAQTFISPEAGQFVLTAKVSSDAEGGSVGISINGIDAEEQAVPAQVEYTSIELGAVTVAENDLVSVYFEGGASWLNVDDVEWKKR